MAIELIDIGIYGKVAGMLIGYSSRLRVSLMNSARMTHGDIIIFVSRLRVLNILCFDFPKRPKVEIQPIKLDFNESASKVQLVEWLQLIRSNIPHDIVSQIKPPVPSFAPLLSFLDRLIKDVESFD